MSAHSLSVTTQTYLGVSTQSECDNTDLGVSTQSECTNTDADVSTQSVNQMSVDEKDPLQMFKEHFSNICNLKKSDFEKTNKTTISCFERHIKKVLLLLTLNGILQRPKKST